MTEVVCDNVQLLESRRAREDSYQGSNNSYNASNNSYSNNSYNSYSAPSSAPSDNASLDNDFNTGDSLVISSDDLPF